MLKHIQNQSKGITNADLLNSLKQHVNCIFDAYLSELTHKKQASQVVKTDATASIKMKPLLLNQSADLNNQKKVAAVVFGDSDLSSASLFEFGKFCLNNKEIINQLLTLKTTGNVSSLNVPTLIKHMPNVLNFDNKRAFFRKELEKLGRD